MQSLFVYQHSSKHWPKMSSRGTANMYSILTLAGLFKILEYLPLQLHSDPEDSYQLEIVAKRLQ